MFNSLHFYHILFYKKLALEIVSILKVTVAILSLFYNHLFGHLETVCCLHDKPQLGYRAFAENYCAVCKALAQVIYRIQISLDSIGPLLRRFCVSNPLHLVLISLALFNIFWTANILVLLMTALILVDYFSLLVISFYVILLVMAQYLLRLNAERTINSPLVALVASFVLSALAVSHDSIELHDALSLPFSVQPDGYISLLLFFDYLFGHQYCSSPNVIPAKNEQSILLVAGISSYHNLY